MYGNEPNMDIVILKAHLHIYSDSSKETLSVSIQSKTRTGPGGPIGP